MNRYHVTISCSYAVTADDEIDAKVKALKMIDEPRVRPSGVSQLSVWGTEINDHMELESN